MTVEERIAALRKLMAERNIDVYYIPNEDDHLSEEYTASYFHAKSWMSGFTGDSGCTIITRDFAGLWTDGRYFTQAEGELEGTEVQLMRMRQPGVPEALDFLVDNTPENGCVGFDGRVVSASNALLLSRRLNQKNAKLHVNEDLVGMIWEDRPSMPKEPLFILESRYTGETIDERIAKVRKDMREKGADVLILTSLEDPCWMLNIRGNDIPYEPVSYAFVMMSQDSIYYYNDAEKINDEVRVYLENSGVSIRPYDALADDLSTLHNQNIWVDLAHLNSAAYTHIAQDNSIINEVSSIVNYRSIKTPVEIECMHKSQEKDGVAMVRFIRWVKENVGKGDMTELSAQNKLYELRAEMPDYIEPSFGTICAYQENGAMMHYSATEEKYSAIHPRGFLLVDSGGTYKDGTTDITRTIKVGELTDQEKMYYTLVLKGHLDLQAARFLFGSSGNNLDILARRPLWNINIDYQCGTGHGVGHVLGVHEGIHGIRWGLPAKGRPHDILRPGMIVTDEPGVYLPHELGIRIENDLLVVEGEKNFYGQFLAFEPMTYCPYELDAIDVNYLEECNIQQINEYHKMVYERLCPYLDEEEKQWLAHETREITK